MKTKFKDVLDEAYKGKKLASGSHPVATFTDQIARMTDQNDHGGALLVLAKELKRKDYIRAVTAVMEIHKAMGSMPSELMKYRDSIMRDLLFYAKKKYSKEDYALINGAF